MGLPGGFSGAAGDGLGGEFFADGGDFFALFVREERVGLFDVAADGLVALFNELVGELLAGFHDCGGEGGFLGVMGDVAFVLAVVFEGGDELILERGFNDALLGVFIDKDDGVGEGLVEVAGLGALVVLEAGAIKEILRAAVGGEEGGKGDGAAGGVGDVLDAGPLGLEGAGGIAAGVETIFDERLEGQAGVLGDFEAARGVSKGGYDARAVGVDGVGGAEGDLIVDGDLEFLNPGGDVEVGLGLHAAVGEEGGGEEEEGAKGDLGFLDPVEFNSKHGVLQSSRSALVKGTNLLSYISTLRTGFRSVFSGGREGGAVDSPFGPYAA